jgi:hypothetical protein
MKIFIFGYEISVAATIYIFHTLNLLLNVASRHLPTPVRNDVKEKSPKCKNKQKESEFIYLFVLVFVHWPAI